MLLVHVLPALLPLLLLHMLERPGTCRGEARLHHPLHPLAAESEQVTGHTVEYGSRPHPHSDLALLL